MGSNKSKQVQEIINRNVNQVVSDTLVSKNITVQQENSGDQLLESISIEPVFPCDRSIQAGDVVISNAKQSKFGVGISLELIDAKDLTSKVVSSIQAASKSDVATKQDGTLAFTKDIKTDQEIKISSETQNQIRTTIDMKLKTLISQRNDGNQTIKVVHVVQQCGSNVTIEQKSIMDAVAADITSSIMKTVMDSKEARDTGLTTDSTVKQEARDTVGQLTGMVENVTKNFADMGFYTILFFIGIPFLLIMLLIVRSVMGGGSKRRHTEEGTEEEKRGFLVRMEDELGDLAEEELRHVRHELESQRAHKKHKPEPQEGVPLEAEEGGFGVQPVPGRVVRRPSSVVLAEAGEHPFEIDTADPGRVRTESQVRLEQGADEVEGLMYQPTERDEERAQQRHQTRGDERPH